MVNPPVGKLIFGRPARATESKWRDVLYPLIIRNVAKKRGIGQPTRNFHFGGWLAAAKYASHFPKKNSRKKFPARSNKPLFSPMLVGEGGKRSLARRQRQSP